MDIGEAKQFANTSVELIWADRNGRDIADTVFVFDVEFLPLYGPCLITSQGEIRLDRVIQCQLAAKIAA
ncbi:MAG: hypothetical protein HZC36_13965 [Armatimonadetes bacterium]|nr:hypothetical protein [Armatimonadota bacterium]